MSTTLRDIPSNALIGNSASPRTATASVTGSNIDARHADGRCTAVQTVGTVSGTSPSLAGKIQESADGTTWADIGGATFAAVTASENAQAISFDRTQRYLRYVGTITGTSPSFGLAAVIIQQKKQV